MIAAGAARPAPAVLPAAWPCVRLPHQAGWRGASQNARFAHPAVPQGHLGRLRRRRALHSPRADPVREFEPRYFGLRHKGATWLNVVNDQAMALGELVGLR